MTNHCVYHLQRSFSLSMLLQSVASPSNTLVWKSSISNTKTKILSLSVLHATSSVAKVRTWTRAHTHTHTQTHLFILAPCFLLLSLFRTRHWRRYPKLLYLELECNLPFDLQTVSGQLWITAHLLTNGRHFLLSSMPQWSERWQWSPCIQVLEGKQAWSSWVSDKMCVNVIRRLNPNPSLCLFVPIQLVWNVSNGTLK